MNNLTESFDICSRRVDKSQLIAVTVKKHLIHNNIFQIELARKLNISSIQLTKLLSGKHDLH
jgi:hypothetical protein